MDLRPMNVGEILDCALTLFKAQYKSYLAIVAASILCLIGAVFIILAAYFTGGKTPAILSSVVFGLLVIAVYLALGAGIVIKASEQIFGREIGITEAYRFGFSKAVSLFFCYVLLSIAVLIGLILLIIPGIYFAILSSFFVQAMVIEGKGPRSALLRSRELVKGYWWRTFGILTLINILVSVLASIAALPFALAAWGLSGELTTLQAVNDIIKTFISFLLIPLSQIAITLLYYDLRIRKENLDIHQMVDSLTTQNNGNLSV